MTCSLGARSLCSMDKMFAGNRTAKRMDSPGSPCLNRAHSTDRRHDTQPVQAELRSAPQDYFSLHQAARFEWLAPRLQLSTVVKNSVPTETSSRLGVLFPQPRLIALSLWLVLFAVPGRTKAEDRADYRYEDYKEGDGRIHVQTHGAYFDVALRPWLSVQGNYIYDSISGATPTGAPSLHGEPDFATVTVGDIRRAGFVQAAIKAGSHTLSPQIAYSEESDYKSLGVSLSDAIDFNEKNTTLSIGISHSFDQVLPNEGEGHWVNGEPVFSIDSAQDKDSTDFLLGVNQLLGPNDVLNVSLTIGYSTGFLNDPYKRVYFDGDGSYYVGPSDDPLFRYIIWPERRPDTKLREVLFLSYQHYFEKLNAGSELTYRLHHDDFGVTAHTVSLEWHQKLGKIFTLSPLIRFHTQTAADFYNTHFPGDPLDQATMPLPKYFSADYRLSALDSLTYGASLSAKVWKHVSLEAAYKRYEMYGRDNITAKGQYPKANVVTVGATVWF